MSKHRSIDTLVAHVRGGRRVGRLAAFVVVVLGVVSATGCGATPPPVAPVASPNSMAAIGDLSTLAAPSIANPPDSWSTGTEPAVNSHYLRILAAHPAIKGRIYNFTTQEIDIRAQAREAVAKHVDYVTIEPSENDMCSGASVAKVAAKLDATLRILTAGLPTAHVFVASARDIARLVDVLGHNEGLRGSTVCQTQVGASAAALAQLHDRFAALNKALAQVCARHPQCRFDDNAVFKMPLTLDDIATDNFTLSATGQRKLAEVTWKATFPFGS